MDPYKVLNVSRNFTLEELKSKYKLLALKVHPDKHSGSDYLFKVVTHCYKLLLNEYNVRVSDKSFIDLKSESKAYRQETNTGSSVSKNKFDLGRFNKMFEDHRIPNIELDTGYSKWMETKVDRNLGQQKSKPNQKFSIDDFNKRFDTVVIDNTCKEVSKRQEPIGMDCKVSKLACSELGVKNVSDYSGGINKSLVYTDYKKAHTTTRLAPRSQRKEYASIDDLERDRGNLKYEMSNREKNDYELAMRQQEIKERKRIEYLKQQDAIAEKQHQKLMQLLHQ